jgi:hypothetical protein
MESQPTDDLGPELHHVTIVLRHALTEACGTEIKQANTGELQRFEEVLGVAKEAAKQMVDLRQKAKRRRRPPRVAEPGASLAAPADLPEATTTHRMFVDETGVAWDAFAVHPSADSAGKARLPEPYRHGWLSFDSGTERRRLSPIPEAWESATDESLARLCATAHPAPRRTAGERRAPEA